MPADARPSECFHADFFVENENTSYILTECRITKIWHPDALAITASWARNASSSSGQYSFVVCWAGPFGSGRTLPRQAARAHVLKRCLSTPGPQTAECRFFMFISNSPCGGDMLSALMSPGAAHLAAGIHQGGARPCSLPPRLAPCSKRPCYRWGSAPANSVDLTPLTLCLMRMFLLKSLSTSVPLPCVTGCSLRACLLRLWRVMRGWNDR